MENTLVQEMQSQYLKRYNDGYVIEEDSVDNDGVNSLIETYYSKDNELLKRITVQRDDSNKNTIRFEIVELFTDGIVSSRSTEMFENDVKTEVITLFYYKDTNIIQTNITNNLVEGTTTILSYFKNGSIRGKAEYRQQDLVSKVMYNEDGSVKSVV